MTAPAYRSPGAPSAAALEASADGDVAVVGELTFDTVAAIWPEALARLDSSRRLTVDLSRVHRSDSAGLALALGWLREARRRGAEVAFTNIPPQMLAIAATTRLDELLFDSS